MLNIPDLEKRWLRYKIRSFLPTTLLILFLIFSAVLYTMLDFTSNEQKETIVKTVVPKAQLIKPIQIKSQEENSTVTKKVAVPTKSKKQESNTTLLSPSMNFMTKFQSSPSQTQPRTISKTKTDGQAPKIYKTKHKELQQVRKLPVSTITITKQDTAKDIKNILKRFQEDKNPALSLFLAKKYYELGEYEKAAKYALITNKLNKEIEDSWLIFSKSLVKMHHKDKAISILRQYIKSSHSTNAAVLLHDIQSGEFQ